MKNFLLLLIIVLNCFKAESQIPIATARTMPTGSTVTVRGMITNGDELGTIRYFEDGTGGIAAYSSSMSGVVRGDSVEVTGVISPYNNLIELNPVNSFTVISSGNPSPAPFEVDMATGYSENYESRLVRFNSSYFISTGTFAGNVNYDATDNSVVSAEVRVVSTTEIVGTPIPVDDLDLVGIMSQYQSTYQLLPRDLDDFVSIGNPPVLTTTPFQFNITTTSFDVSFSTQNPGNTILYYGLTSSLGNSVNDATLVTEHSATISGLTAATLYYVKAASVSSTNDTSYSATIPMFTQSLSSQSIKCYFTRSVDNSVAQGTNSIQLPQTADDTLIAYMNRAKYTMDIAIYNMDNNNGIVDAINAAYNRGVTVRIIGDGDNMGSGAWGQLLLPNSNKKLSPTSIDYGIMHNKFVSIDANSADANDAVLWTGSMNFTDAQVNSDANNIIIFQDQSLARAYEMEFEEMWSGAFGSFKQNNTAKEFNIGGNRVELYFSPSDDTESEIERKIESADHDLEFCMFAYTRFSISYSIDDRTDAGVWGGGIIDDTTNGGYAFSIIEQNMSNSLFVVSYSYLLHNKYLIVDGNAPGLDPLVLTGSHNWTTSAQTKNDENTIVVHNASIANQYYQEWVARYHDAGGVELPTYNVGINDFPTGSTGFQFYPNPTTDAVHVILNSKEEAIIQLTDLSGKVLQQFSSDNSDEVDMSVKDFSIGIYLLTVKQGEKCGVVKLVVER